MTESASSTGLPTRVAAPLAYFGGWVTGIVFWFLERRDAEARFHGAQSAIAFGAIAVLLGLLGMLSLAALSFFPGAFDGLVLLAEAVAIAAVLLWIASMIATAAGRSWRLPLAAPLADRLLTGGPFLRRARYVVRIRRT